MLNSFPNEVLQKILQLATSVPSAFDTSVEGSISDKENDISLAIEQSMRTKLALCRVSKSFYALAIVNLYEIVTIRSFGNVHRLARLFRVRNKLGGILRGWYCRRLELCFARETGGPEGTPWDCEEKNLWGLADACPNLVIFIADIAPSRRRYSDDITEFRIPRHLFQTIAHTCAKMLRRFEMRGATSVRFDRVEMLLRYCPVIEVCRLNTVFALGNPPTYDLPSPVSDWDYEWQEPIEPVEQRFPEPGWPQPTADAPEGLENAPLVLPHLHTLEIIKGSVVRSNWSLPNLHTLGLKFDHERDARGVTLSLITQRLAGVLPFTQITRFSYSGTSSIVWAVINSFPNLMEFGFSSEDTQLVRLHRAPQLLLHSNLAKIKLCPASLDSLEDFIDYITDAFTNGLLPALKSLQVYGFVSDTHRRMATHRIVKMNELGVKCEIVGGHGGWLLHVSKIFGHVRRSLLKPCPYDSTGELYNSDAC